MIKALIFDVDNTLIKKGKAEVEASAIEAINRAREAGLKIIVATGRGYKFMQKDIKERVKADYYVMVNGGCVNNTDGQVVLTHPLSKEITEALIEKCLEKDYAFGMKFDDSLQVYHNWQSFVDQYCNAAVPVSAMDDNTSTMDYHLTHGMPLDCFIFSDNDEALNLATQFPQLVFYKASIGGIECIPADVNKGKTIKELTDMLGISLDQCMAFGDAENDIDMLKMCGIGVAMGNGEESVKAIADYVTTDILDDGIYNALKHFEII